MEINDAQVNNFIQLVNLRKSNLELLEGVRKLADAIEKLQLALQNFQDEVEEQQLKQLQIDFQNEVKSRNLEADFQETLARLDLD
jgi:transposase-like protein